MRFAPRLRLGSAPTALLCAASLLAFGRRASADEIRYTDPKKCEPAVLQVAEITEETWTTIAYKVKAKGAIERMEMRFVTDVRRTAEDAQTKAYAAAATELSNGSLTAARFGFGSVAGGGLVQDGESGALVFKAFPAAEAGKAKWYADYAQYHYALCLVREGLFKNETPLLEAALKVIDGDGGAEKGFLARYKEGKSRWYADALLLRAQTLLGLKRYDEAATAFDALYEKSIRNPIGVRFSYEAKIGPGRIAEAKGSNQDAGMAYDAASAALQSLFDQATDACSRRDLGRLYNEARMQRARVMLEAAQKTEAPSDYAELRKYLEAGRPEALRTKFAGKPAEVIDAVVAGALAPTVQAVAQTGIGLAFLSEKKYSEAVFALTNVRIKYFAVGEAVPRALYYLAKAADAAAAAAQRPDAKSLYQSQADAARQELSRSWSTTPWASKK